jgi:hypothetical protein
MFLFCRDSSHRQADAVAGVLSRRLDRFNIWHKEIGRGAYIMENGGNGYCPLVPKMCDNGIFVSGSWSYFMDNISQQPTTNRSTDIVGA